MIDVLDGVLIAALVIALVGFWIALLAAVEGIGDLSARVRRLEERFPEPAAEVFADPAAVEATH